VDQQSGILEIIPNKVDCAAARLPRRSIIGALLAILRLLAMLIWLRNERAQSNTPNKTWRLPIKVWRFANHPPSCWAVP
jgi:hypothetical protein